MECGEKNHPLLVFIHGGGVSGWMWKNQLEHFKDYHCLAVDLPEHGNSDGEFSIAGSAEQINQLIRQKALGKRVHVIGFSLGAQVLIEMLARNPGVVDAAVINSALVRPVKYAVNMVGPAARLSLPLAKSRKFARMQAKAMYIDEKLFEIYYQESRQIKAETFVRVMRENLAYELPGNLSQVTARILVMVGEKEKKMMKRSAADIVNGNRNATGMIVPGIGHGISLANPALFNELVRKWLEEGLLPPEMKIIHQK